MRLYNYTVFDHTPLKHPLNLLCICPTYGRPRLLANSLSCFLQQEYPKEHCKLLILDDAGQYTPQSGSNWTLVSIPHRLASLPEKYHAMFTMEGICPFNIHNPRRWDAVVIWDDDDIYLPNHLWHHSRELQTHAWSYPQTVYKLDDPTKLRTENPQGNMWASIAVRTTAIREVGFPRTKVASFDLQFLGSLHKHSKPGRSLHRTFMFRWGSTRHPHQQNYIQGPFDTDQYDKFPQHDRTYVETLEPLMDEETFFYYDLYHRGRLNDPVPLPPFEGYAVRRTSRVP